jgi:recombination protein RecA
MEGLISGDFYKGVPLGKVTVFAGEPQAGKSFISSGNIVHNAQQQGIFVILIDTENALDEHWLKALDVDTHEKKLLKLSLSMVDDVAKTVSTFMKSYKQEYKENKEGAPKILFVIDSLGMLLTPTDVDQFERGDMKGDLGRKAKSLTALVRNCVNMFGSWNVGLVATNHTYASQDMFDPDDKISGGQGFIYASSIVIAMKKLKLKEDEQGNKITNVRGIRAACKIMKTRFAKPFESVQVKIPYETGMDPYSGLVDLFEKKGLLTQQGNRLKYIDKKGIEHLDYRKQWTGDKLEVIMHDVSNINVEEKTTKNDPPEVSKDITAGE